MLKRAINKKKKDQREHEEKEKSQLLETIPDLQKEIANIKKELIDKEKEIDSYSNDSALLKSLYEKGFIDLDGNIIQ